MPEEASYKHIKATPAPDDDVVVVAGLPSSDAAASAGAIAARSKAASEVVDSAPLADSSASVSGAAASASASVAGKVDGDNEPAAGMDAAHENDAQVAHSHDGGYRETTLEDIEGSKMSPTQLVVIGVSLICLAAFIIWYIFFS